MNAIGGSYPANLHYLVLVMRINGFMSIQWINRYSTHDTYLMVEAKELKTDPSETQEAGIQFRYDYSSGVLYYVSSYFRRMYYHDNYGNVEITFGSHNPGDSQLYFYSIYGLFDQ